jgi:di/tricarboxylate transporter
MTPYGYQTNLMVMGPGNYRFADYVKFGAPLTVMFWLIAAAVIPLLWSF